MPLYELAGKRPSLGIDAWVAPSAELIADVVLGDEANIWFGAVVRTIPRSRSARAPTSRKARCCIPIPAPR